MCTISEMVRRLQCQKFHFTHTFIEVSFRSNICICWLDRVIAQTSIRPISQLQNPDENGKLFKYSWFYHIFLQIWKRCEQNSFTKTFICDAKSFRDITEVVQSMAMQIKLEKHQNCKSLHFIWEDIFWHLRRGSKFNKRRTPFPKLKLK